MNAGWPRAEGLALVSRNLPHRSPTTLKQVSQTELTSPALQRYLVRGLLCPDLPAPLCPSLSRAQMGSFQRIWQPTWKGDTCGMGEECLCTGWASACQPRKEGLLHTRTHRAFVFVVSEKITTSWLYCCEDISNSAFLPPSLSWIFKTGSHVPQASLKVTMWLMMTSNS